MKNPITTCILLCVLLFSAQPFFGQNLEPESKIAFINSVDLLESVPGKSTATATITGLNEKYKEELQVMQNDYNKKYSDFITYQGSMAESIKLRRMQELYELEKSISTFIQVAKEDVASQEQHLIVPLKETLKTAIDQVGREHGFECIYDLSNLAISFVTPKAVDANPLVKAILQRTNKN